MGAAHTTHPQERFPFCIVDEFLASMAHTTVLHAAFEVGLIDRLVAGPSRRRELCRALELDGRTSGVLFDSLIAHGVLESRSGGLALTPRFRQALVYRDLLQTSLQLAQLCARDAVESFAMQVRDRKAYMKRSAMFEFFHYFSDLDYNAEEMVRAERWMRCLSTLTRYDAPILSAYHDFTPYRRVLDVGGNSGALAVHLCELAEHLRVSVLDLPVVCAVGEQMVQDSPAADRVRFVRGDVRTDPLPDGFDAVVFKSMLHDWQRAGARSLLQRAHAALQPGGRVIIFERRPLTADALQWPGEAVWLTLQAWRRGTDFYVRLLEELGFHSVVARDDLPRGYGLVAAER